MAKHQTRLSTQNASMATRGTPPRRAKASRQPVPTASARRLPNAAAKRAAAAAAASKAAASESAKAATTPVPTASAQTPVAKPKEAADAEPQPVANAPDAATATSVSSATATQQQTDEAATASTTSAAEAAVAPLATAEQLPHDAPVAVAVPSVTPPLTATGAPDRRFGRRGGRKPRQTTPLPPQVMEPYDGLTCRVVREECGRRMISIWSNENRAYRHKQGYIQLLRMDDQRRAAQHASAQRHKQDLEAIERGTLDASAAAPASPSASANAVATSFLSPSALTAPPPATGAAAKAPAVYAPKALLTESKRPATPSAAPAAVATKRSPSAGPPVRIVRARRSCYFRLINVMLSSDFNVRWHEMDAAVTGTDAAADVNQFWLDVHVAFMSVNQLYDGLHFHDPLFRLIDPGVILVHEASRLRQMWHDVVRLYQCAVARAAQAADASDGDDAQLSFYEHCLKRLDVLYLHMGLLLEPELSARVAKMAPSTNPFGSQRLQSAPARSSAATALRNGKAKRTSQTSAATKSVVSTPKRSGAKQSPARMSKAVKPRATPPPLQPSLEAADTLASPAQAGEPEEQSYALVVSGELRDAAFETFAPHALPDDGYGSSDYDGELPPRAMASRKRRRSDTSTEIVELHSSIVPHASAARMAHSTALTTRSGPSAVSTTDAMQPLDEWDILEGRIRKVNESLDRCHRALSGADGLVSDSHRMTLEHDLRFYSAIKQRLQEQLLMVMQGY